MGFNQWDGDHFVTTDVCSRGPIRKPGSPTPAGNQHDGTARLLLHHRTGHLRGLHISERGRAVQDALDGFYNGRGEFPARWMGPEMLRPSIGASGLRMLYEMYLQLHGRAGDRQIENPRFGLTHNLAGALHERLQHCHCGKV